MREQEFMDARLGGVMVATNVLADFDHFRAWVGQREHFVADQAVVQDDIGLGQCACRVEREQARIAGAGTHQAHNADRRRIGNRNGRRT